MDEVIGAVSLIGLAFFAVLESVLFSECVLCILEKDRRWRRMFLISFGLIVFLAVIYTWVPGAFGMEITVSDLEVPIENGMLFRNFGLMCLLNGGSILLAVGKHLWRSYKDKTKPVGKFIRVELLFVAGFGVLGGLCAANDTVIDVPLSRGTARAILLLFALLGGGALAYFFLSDRRDKKAQKKEEAVPASPQAAPQPPRQAPRQAVSSGDEAEYLRVAEQRKRLAAAGDYASQIPLLIKATELHIDNVKKANLWNWMGAAYEKIHSCEKGVECYRMALQFDRDNPAALNNLALTAAENADWETAKRYMQKALQEAEKRGYSLGLYYANCGYICGCSGDRQTAEYLLKQAEENGYPAAELRTVRNKAGLS